MINKTLQFLSIICVLITGTVSAGEVTDLYQANVAADSTQWQQEALLQVLVRVTGKADIGAEAAFSDELKKASGYIKQYEAVRHAQGNQLKVLLDAGKINSFLQQHNIAVWGALRPDILVWLVQQDAGNRRFVRRNDEPLNVEMRQAFHQAGLPLVNPLYDMDDLTSLSETDIWAGFWQPINQASTRYKSDVVLSVTTDKIMQDGEALYRLNWQRQDNGRTYRDEVTATDETSLMQHFAAMLATQLAERYASVMLAQDSAEYVLQVQQLTSLSDVVQVQKLLQQMVGIADVTISRYDSGTVLYALKSNISTEGLMNALRFTPQLRIKQTDNNAIGSTVEQPVNTLALPILATFEYVRT